jgi:hypothetical protein
MQKFLEENGFIKIPKRGKHVKAIYNHPDCDIFLTFFNNGKWSVSKAGNDNLEELEEWRNLIAQHMEKSI